MYEAIRDFFAGIWRIKILSPSKNSETLGSANQTP